MRSFLPLLATAAIAGSAAFSGCGNSDTDNTKNDVTSATVTAGSGQSPCNSGAPDTYCNAVGNNPETCECSDCFASAMCNGGCTDDGNCDMGGGEDCSCADCAFKVLGCPPDVCHYDDQSGYYDYCYCNHDDDEQTAACTLDDACTCPECAGAAQCAACNDDGQCAPLSESCSCGDCANSPVCGGDPSTSSSSSSSSGGGNGGGSTTSTTSSTTAASTTTGSAGGGGGNGGAGGN